MQMKLGGGGRGGVVGINVLRGEEVGDGEAKLCNLEFHPRAERIVGAGNVKETVCQFY